jgi:hypothetical protein
MDVKNEKMDVKNESLRNEKYDKEQQEKLDVKNEKEQQERRDKEKRDEEKRDKDKRDEENYIKSIKWPKTEDEWINFDFKTIRAGTLMPFKKPPRHQIEPEVPRHPDGTIIVIDHKQVEIDKLKAKLESLPEGKQLSKVEEQERKIDMLTEHLIQITNQLNELTKKKLK